MSPTTCGLGAERARRRRQGRHADGRRRQRRRQARLPLRRRHRMLVLNTGKRLRAEGRQRHRLQARQGRPGLRRLRRRRPPRPVRAADGRQVQAVPERRQGQVHRRDRQGRRPGEVDRPGDVVPRGATSTTTASSTWSSAACAARTASSEQGRRHASRTPADEIGLTQKVFNTPGRRLVDLNGDGMLDMVFNNEGQDRRPARQQGHAGRASVRRSSLHLAAGSGRQPASRCSTRTARRCRDARCLRRRRPRRPAQRCSPRFAARRRATTSVERAPQPRARAATHASHRWPTAPMR